MSYRPFTTKDLYKILGIESSATGEEIKKAFRQQSLKSHPDKAGNTPENNHKFAEIKEAYDILSNEESRKGYDAYLARNSSSEQSPSSSSSSSRDSHRESRRESHRESHRESRRASRHDTYRGSYRYSRHEESGQSSRRQTREPSYGFNSSFQNNQDYWEDLRTPRNDSHPDTNSSHNKPGHSKAYYRRETIRHGLAALAPLGTQIQTNINNLTINHQALWNDFSYYGLTKGVDSDLWYGLFDATRAVNRQIGEAWDDVVRENREFHSGTMRPGSEDLVWRICDIHAKVLHMVLTTNVLKEISFILSYNFASSYPEIKDEMVWLFKTWKNAVIR